jgi:serine-type D-Ala-D-Ala carboxypeptidase/endopeptidase
LGIGWFAEAGNLLFLAMLLRVFVFLSILLAGLAAGAQRQRTGIDSLVDKSVEGFMAKPEHVGLSIGILWRGKTYTFNYGTVEKGRSIRPSASTIYEIASLTKSFTGILLAHAVVEGKLALGDDIRKWLPGRFPNLAYAGRPITVLDLATHTGGLPKSIPPLGGGLSPDQMVARWRFFSRADFLREVAKLKPDTLPGTRYAYSNVGTQLVEIILEKLYGVSYGELLQRYITGPWHMARTKLELNASDSGLFARGYDAGGRQMPEVVFWRPLPAAGYLKSNIVDLLQYLRLNMREVEPAIALAHKPFFLNTDEAGEAIGLFWFSAPVPGGYRKIDHAGGSFGFTSYCLAYPHERLGIVCLTNDASPGTEHELREMAAGITGVLMR